MISTLFFPDADVVAFSSPCATDNNRNYSTKIHDKSTLNEMFKKEIKRKECLTSISDYHTPKQIGDNN
jgi:hypothetical protein